MHPDALRARLDHTDTHALEGRVVAVTGSTLRVVAPALRIGERVTIDRPDGPLVCEVVGFEASTAVVMPLGDPHGVGLDDPVRFNRGPFTFPCGDAVLGRVLDGLGAPLDGRGPIPGPVCAWPLERAAPDVWTRPRITRAMPVGVRVIDALATLGEGQRLGIFAGAGVGKSVLLGQIARGCDADVVVIGLVGERGREVGEFLHEFVGPEAMTRTCVVVATSDAPALVRVRAAFVATSVAEYFRDQGKRVLLVLDSLTRVARAQREVGLAAGEPPTRRGFPPSVFSLLPRLLERAGMNRVGSITGVYTVLVEGGDLEEPIADDVRATVDGHIVLDRALAARGRFPAVDPVRSLSRVMGAVVGGAHGEAAITLRRWLGAYEARRDLMAVGAYQRGADPDADAAVERIAAIERFLAQRSDATSAYAESVARLIDLVRSPSG